LDSVSGSGYLWDQSEIGTTQFQFRKSCTVTDFKMYDIFMVTFFSINFTPALNFYLALVWWQYQMNHWSYAYEF
jgi:hypothetical protein